ncbi:YniB family protein [Xanthomonas sp. WHRI 1810A]|uniref:YniB family protein n=1 Tax=Xanthomonas sp. WHRI 1810A TaxID=3161565 RepID=UPI0032E8AA7A
MTVLEAIKKAKKMKWSGLAIALLGLIQLAMFGVLFLYDMGGQLAASGLAMLGGKLQYLCLIAYENTAFLKPLWAVTPRIDIYHPFTVDSLMLLGVFVVIATGLYIRGCGIQLSNDVAAIRKRARDELWLRSMLPSDEATTVINQPASVTVLTLQMPPGEVKSWWERPIGLLLMGLAITYLGALLTRLAGLT